MKKPLKTFFIVVIAINLTLAMLLSIYTIGSDRNPSGGKTSVPTQEDLYGTPAQQHGSAVVYVENAAMQTAAPSPSQQNTQRDAETDSATAGVPDTSKLPDVQYAPSSANAQGGNQSDASTHDQNGSSFASSAQTTNTPASDTAGSSAVTRPPPVELANPAKPAASFGITVSYPGSTAMIGTSPLRFSNSKRLNELAYFRFGLLNDVEKMLYSEIKRAVYSTQNIINFENASFTQANVISAFNAYYMDHPESFWLDSTSFLTSFFAGTFTLTLFYTDGTVSEKSGAAVDRTVITGQIGEFASTAKAMLNSAAVISAQDGKERSLFDAVIKTSRYDYDYFNGKVNRISSNYAYGALVLGLSVCGGYSNALQYLLYECGINSLKVLGSGHMWNMAQVNGIWYHLDSTWADTSTTNYFYFNATTSEISRTQTVSAENPALPAANTKYAK